MANPFATENFRLSSTVMQELWPEAGYTRSVVVVNDTAATLTVGTVLGKVTSGGKYKVAVETASDGSKVADAIVIQETAVAGSTDTNVLVLIKGPAVVKKSGLTLDASYDNDAKKNAVYAALEAKGIQVNTAV